jgi:CubicO group peptidase (beta-lactamase class C family)
MAEDSGWEVIAPEAERMSSRRLAAWAEALAVRDTTHLLVMRHGRIVYEWYAPGTAADTPHGTASLAKALVGGLSLALVLEDGLLGLDDPVSRWIPAWAEHPLKAQVTIRQLATHASGLEDANAPGIGHMELGGWKEAFWRREPDPFTIARDLVPFATRPGTAFGYSNPGMAILAYCITAALRGSPHEDIYTLLRERIMHPLGISDEEWSIGYRMGYPLDGMCLCAIWGGATITARAAARLGLLLLRGGAWGERQILAPEWARRLGFAAGAPIPERRQDNPVPLPGLCWWLNADGVWPWLPRDAFLGLGAGHQMLLCVPSMDLVVARFGDWLGKAREFGEAWGDLVEQLVIPLTDTFTDRGEEDMASAPYPQSTAIKGIRWDAPSTIVRVAYDSDNWPITWADDDALYAAYGDGRGFEPYTETKLGLGFARVDGHPEAFKGVNVRSETGENLGMGARGAKASGMLSADGLLYMLARNAGNSQLAWSKDRGLAWEWADWRFTESFGYPTFLNYARDYAGARDGYVYVYSHDAESAYVPADRMVLARVPRDRIREREAYTFYAGVDASGQPQWDPDIARRGAVFEHPGRCARSSVCYLPGLKRYLWWQNIPNGSDVDTRFRGGFGLYDAPEPWGPWTTAYYTAEWDVGPGEMAVIPTKWLVEDGRGFYLVFSGYDYFSVRRGTFV